MTPRRGGARKNRSVEKSFRANKSSETPLWKRLEREARTRVRVSRDIRRRSRHTWGEKKRERKRENWKRAARGAIMARTNKREGLNWNSELLRGPRASERDEEIAIPAVRRKTVCTPPRTQRFLGSPRNKNERKKEGRRIARRGARQEGIADTSKPRRNKNGDLARGGEETKTEKKETRADFNVSFEAGIEHEDSAVTLLRLLLILYPARTKTNNDDIFLYLVAEEHWRMISYSLVLMLPESKMSF